LSGAKAPLRGSQGLAASNSVCIAARTGAFVPCAAKPFRGS
jgi:hypothetical protein